MKYFILKCVAKT